MDDVGDDGSIVEYGINGFALSATGTTEKFVDGGPAEHTQYIHRVGLSFSLIIHFYYLRPWHLQV